MVDQVVLFAETEMTRYGLPW